MIDVAWTPAQLRRTDVAVVIDVLRATSTVTQALAAGYHAVLCAKDFESAIGLRAPGRVLAGERRCAMPPGFDQGNSPLEAQERHGRELVLATTNGTPAIVAATGYAPCVMVASLLNLGAVVRSLERICARADTDVQLVCAGTDGAPALEDAYVAGRLCRELTGGRTDAALIAEALAGRYRTPLEALAASQGARALRAAGMDDDVVRCAQEPLLDVVPRALAPGDRIVVMVAEGPGGEAAAASFDARDTVERMHEPAEPGFGAPLCASARARA